MPSSSARFTQLPRAIDKVPFYEALKKFRDHLKGIIPHLDDSEIIFKDLVLKTAPRKEPQVKTEPAEKKPVVKKPRKKRTSAAEPKLGHITGGSTRLTKAHHSLIEQALMMSSEPAPSAEGTPPNMPYPPNMMQPYLGGQQPESQIGPYYPGNDTGAFQPQMMYPSNGMGFFNPVTTAGSFMDPAAQQSMASNFVTNPDLQTMQLLTPKKENGQSGDGQQSDENNAG